MGRRERRLAARRLLVEPTQPQETQGVGKIGKFFDRHYHKIQIIPLVILLASIAFLVVFTLQHGDFVRKGVSLAGGTSVTVSTQEQIDVRSLEASLQAAFPEMDLALRVLRSAGAQTGFTVDAASDAPATEIEASLVDWLRERYPSAAISVETTGSSLGDAFFKQTLIAVIIAFILMAGVVFLSFRTFYPSMAVVLAGFSTCVSTLAVFNLLGLQLSTAGVAAFLMLIGYSIDTDILLSTRVLKGEGPFVQRVWSAAKTGLTMQVATALAVSAVLIFSNNATFSQIMTIILIGMGFDMLYTWIQNAAILQWYVERGGK